MANNSNITVRQPPRDESISVDTEAIAELVPVALLIIVANGLVLVLFAKRTQLRTPANYVLFSLAACDFMTGIINIPLFIIVAFTSIFASFEFRSYLFYLVTAVHTLTAISACYHILAATTEKYLSIIWPVKHRLMTRKTVINLLEAVWVASFIVAFIPFAWSNMEDTETQAKLGLGHVIFCFVAVFLLPYAFMIYAFVVIFKSISHQGKTKGSILSREHRSRQAALEKRCLILFASMATIFLVCWLPWFILMLLFKVKSNAEELEIPAHVFVLVRYATSIINPALYTFFRRDFNSALKSSLKNKRSQRYSFPLVSLKDRDLNAPLNNLEAANTAENVV
ncbi:octopamine receptor beta-2R-like [Oculina patagonica]